MGDSGHGGLTFVLWCVNDNAKEFSRPGLGTRDKAEADHADPT